MEIFNAAVKVLLMTNRQVDIGYENKKLIGICFSNPTNRYQQSPFYSIQRRQHKMFTISIHV